MTTSAEVGVKGGRDDLVQLSEVVLPQIDAPATATRTPRRDDSVVVATSPWRLRDAAWCSALTALLSVAVAAVLAIASHATGIELVDSGFWPKSVSALPGEAIKRMMPALAVWMLFVRAGAPRRRVLGMGRPVGVLPIAVASAVGGLLIGVKGLVALVVHRQAELFPVRFEGAPHFSDVAGQMLSGPGLLLTLLVVGVAAALAEELLYRGVVFGALRDRLGVRMALPLSACVFAIAHPSGAMPFAFAAALLLAWLYHRSGSLWPGIALHGVNNITTMLALAAALPS